MARFFRRRRRFRRRFPKKMRRAIPKSIRVNNRIHSYKQNAEFTNIQVLANSGFTGFSFSFQISDINNSASIGNLYDQFRLNAVKITFWPQLDSYSTTNTSSATNTPIIYTAIDFDNAATPSNAGTLDQYTTLKKSYFKRPHSRYFHPQALAAMYLSSTQTGYYNVRKPWVNMTNQALPHYGIIGAIISTNSADTVEQFVRVTCTYYFQCRNVR